MTDVLGETSYATNLDERPFPLVLHIAIGLNRAILDALADAGVAIQGPCGVVRVPLRPPFPEDAVRCPLCTAIQRGEWETP